MNEGKIFESSFKASVPNDYLLYRLPDPAQSFGGNSKLRFSRRNPFDYLLWDSSNRILFALELKTVKGKSISFERGKDEHGEIHFYQIEGLNTWNKYAGIVCGFVIEFRGIETTIFLDIDSFNTLIENINKKSFTLSDIISNNLEYTVIPQQKIRKKYRYDVVSFIKDIVKSRDR